MRGKRSTLQLRILSGLAVALTVLLHPTPSSAQSVDWVRQFGTEHTEMSTGIARTKALVLVVGNATDGLPDSTANGVGCFVRAFDYIGNTVWTNTFACDTGSRASVSVHKGGIYVASSFPGVASVQRFDTSGELTWQTLLGADTRRGAIPYTISATGSGVYVGGEVTGSFHGESSEGGADAFVTKLSLTGARMWVRQFGTDGNDLAFGVSATSSGVYLAGREASPAAEAGFLAAYSRGGQQHWYQGGKTQFPEGLHATSEALFATGFVQNSSPTLGSHQAFVQRTDLSGDVEWTRTLAGVSEGASPGTDARAISVIGRRVYIAGSTSGEFEGQTQLGETDSFFARYSTAGRKRWILQAGTDGGQDGAYAVVATPSSGVYFAGRTTGAFPGYTPQGEHDAYLLHTPA
ncbi:MAG: hypothetical protein WD556_06270 [Actinomycetota bacterium]